MDRAVTTYRLPRNTVGLTANKGNQSLDTTFMLPITTLASIRVYPSLSGGLYYSISYKNGW
jgi:hypothetical protein